jgi:hypothetical protein
MECNGYLVKACEILPSYLHAQGILSVLSKRSQNTVSKLVETYAEELKLLLSGQVDPDVREQLRVFSYRNTDRSGRCNSIYGPAHLCFLIND